MSSIQVFRIEHLEFGDNSRKTFSIPFVKVTSLFLSVLEDASTNFFFCTNFGSSYAMKKTNGSISTFRYASQFCPCHYHRPWVSKKTTHQDAPTCAYIATTIKITDQIRVKKCVLSFTKLAVPCAQE